MQSTAPDSTPQNNAKFRMMKQEVDKLIIQKTIEEAFPSKRAYTSHLFVKQKTWENFGLF